MQEFKQSLKSRFPILSRMWKSMIHLSYRSKSPDQIFQEIYTRNRWADKQSLSGPGSSLAQTDAVRKALPFVVEEYGIQHLLDVPCGDFSWMGEVNLSIHYTGGDIVEELIRENQEKYGRGHRRFLKIDLLNDPLPEADLLLCRDCLVHFSYKHISQALANIKASHCRYVLLTTFTSRINNHDIITGAWRPLNLQADPFYFPAPLRLIDEKCSEDNGAYSDKQLGLWNTADLPVLDISRSVKI